MKEIIFTFQKVCFILMSKNSGSARLKIGHIATYLLLFASIYAFMGKAYSNASQDLQKQDSSFSSRLFDKGITFVYQH